jgi:hypothetical protein
LPRWLQNVSSISNGVAPNRSAASATSDGATKRNTAEGSTKRRDKPGTGDTIDLRARAGNPECSASIIPLGQVVGPHQWCVGLGPGVKAAFEILGARTGMAQPCGNALTEFLPPPADDDNELTGVLIGPACDILVAASNARREHARVSRVISVDADIDDDRRLGRSDEPDKLSNSNGLRSGHVRPFLACEVRRRDASAEASRGDRGQPLSSKG